jgi:hypothetical protein
MPRCFLNIEHTQLPGQKPFGLTRDIEERLRPETDGASRSDAILKPICRISVTTELEIANERE